MKPVISVLIPSRRRAKALAAAVASLINLAADPSSIELIVRLDDDDPSEVPPACRVLRGPRHRGYLDLHVFWNELAAASHGNWLFCFNDDALIATAPWDSYVPVWSPSLVLAPYDDSTENCWPAFPLISRRAYEAQGFLTQFAGVDSWWVRMMQTLDRPIERLPFEIRHLRPQMGDQTAADSAAAAAELCTDYDLTSRAEWQRKIDAAAADLRGLL